MSDLISFNQFKDLFSSHQANDHLTIRYSKKTGNKEIDISCQSDKFYLTEDSRQTEVTSESLKKEHAYLTTFFALLNRTPPPKVSAWKDFKTSNHKFKWLVRNCALNTFLVGGIVGRIIAFSANKENPYYRTTPSRILAKTLGPIIFAAGFKKPTLKEKGLIVIDRVLYKQFQSLRSYNPVYQSESGSQIKFEHSQVPVQLRKEQVNLETITASNRLVNPDDPNHLHIIYFNGNSGCFEESYRLVAEDLIHYAEDDNVAATATMFNYPGVLNSTCNTEIVAPELIDAGIKQVQTLLDKGVPHDKIALHGVSLGGSIASHVAAHFHKLKMKDDPKKTQSLGGLYAAKTFASTAQVGLDFFNRGMGDNIVSRKISTFCLPFIKLGTWGAEWDLDTGKAFFSLPYEKRNYSVVISSKEDRKKYSKLHRGTLSKRFFDFILRRKNNPVDDPILRRGLHNSYERKKEKFWIKWGFRGKTKKKEYPELNRSRKMVVVDLKTNQPRPDIDGHAKADYCYQKPNGEWHNPRKRKVLGLIHRTPTNGKIPEAGSVARQSILKMVGLTKL